MGPREGPRVFARMREKIVILFFYLRGIFYIYLNKQTDMKRKNEFLDLKLRIITIANNLINVSMVERDYEKWFLGNSLGTIIMAADNNADMEEIAKFFEDFCERKRVEHNIAEAENIQKLAEKINNMPTREFKCITDLLDGTGVCLN